MPSPFRETSPNGFIVLGVNEKYQFRLGRNATGPWLIEDLEATKEAQSDSGTLAAFEPEGFLRLNFPFSLPGTNRSLSEMLASADFKVGRSVVTSKGMLEIDFTIDSAPDFNAGNMFSSLRSGQLVVDLNNKWRLIRKATSVLFKGGATYASEVTFEYPLKKTAATDLPTSSIGMVFHPGDIVSEAEIRYTWDFSGDQLAARDFTLSAYGLPEPEWARASPWRWVRIAIFASVGCVAAYMLYRRLRIPRHVRSFKPKRS
jgi:hypothetical protein